MHRHCAWQVIQLSDLYTVVHVVLGSSSFHEALSSVNSTKSNTHNGHQFNHPNASDNQQFHDVRHFLQRVESTTPGCSLFTIIFPMTSGTLSRSDFVSIRMQGCPNLTSVRDCLSPLHWYSTLQSPNSTSFVVSSHHDLLNLAKQSAAVIQWKDLCASTSQSELHQYLAGITEQLKYRLSCPCLSPLPIPRKRVALIRGRPNITAGGPVYLAAKALGVDLVIIDDKDHWLQPDTRQNRDHREAFLATDMAEDSGVVDRIVSVIRGYPLPIHGICTLSDNFFVTVSRVAMALGLPTCPVSAFEISVDKFSSRLLQEGSGQAARVQSVEQLHRLMKNEGFSPIFPLIVKPANAWSSECVSKVRTLGDLDTAVRKAVDRRRGAAVIEPFFDGPEIDVNFILLRGKILFYEVVDEPPSEADAVDATVNHTFSPVALTLPSNLPTEEQGIAKSTLHALLIKAGFHTGVFHVEARMVNSTYEYRDNGKGIIGLGPKPASRTPQQKPTCHLLEINARPPAYRVTLASRFTYGIDYFAAHILAAIGDYERLLLMTQPFNFESVYDRVSAAQCWTQLLYIPATAEGTVRSDQPCEELRKRRPDLAQYIVFASDYCQKGDRVSLLTDGTRTIVAHLLVRSRISRQHVMAIGEDVRKSFLIDIDEKTLGCTTAEIGK